MFCSKCGTANTDGSAFCVKCGSRLNTNTHSLGPKVMLAPEEVVEHKEVKDSSKTFSGYGKVFGWILMIVSVLGDLAAMFAIGFDAFIPITIGATALFVVGFLITMFGN
ncbi:MAG: zinc ribbon domain-containing protein [Oscillibacter sp.]|nr:zinc ribbon domain-containing protein [Oscillibacter sp.]